MEKSLPEKSLNTAFYLFIENEKNLSNEFFTHIGVKNIEFDSKDYKFLEPLLSDSSFMSNMRTLVDEVHKDVYDGNSSSDETFNTVLSDFLHTLYVYRWNDFLSSNDFISRNEVIEKIALRAHINSMLGYDYDKYLLLHKKLLIGAVSVNLLEKRHTLIIKNNGKWSSIVYFKPNFFNIPMTNLPLGFSDRPFTIVNIGPRYSLSSFRNIWKLKRKKKEMENFYIPEDGLVRSNDIGLFLSKENYTLNSINIEEEEKRLFKLVECLDIDEYFNKIKKNSSDFKVLKNLYDEYYKKMNEDKHAFNEITSLKELYREISEEKKIFKYFQEILSIQILKKISLDKKLYLPCFMDNRGRQYYNTLISPTFYVLFRHLYKFAEDRDFKFLKDSIFYKRIIAYRYLVADYNLSDERSYNLLVLFIEIGKTFIEKKECIIATEDIIKCGILNYKKLNKNVCFKDLLYIEKIYSSIDKVISGCIDANLIVYKDATASGLQNYGVILGYKKKMLKYLNLDGYDWCDTYQYLIQKFLDVDEKFIFIKKRKYWKGTIMTIPYNATWFSCFKSFLDAMAEDSILYKDFSSDEKDYLKKIHKKFYDDLKDKVKSEFYLNLNTNLRQFKYNTWKIVSRHEYKISFKKKRDKYLNTLYMLNYDQKKTEAALEANNMHYLDAALVRYIIKNIDVIPVHDCFGVRLCDLHLFMDLANKYYSRYCEGDYYCTHILI